MPKQTGRRLLVQRQLLTTVLNEATWKDGMLRTTLLEQRKLNKSEWEGWVGTGRDFEDWLPGRTRTWDLMRVKQGIHSTLLIVLAAWAAVGASRRPGAALSQRNRRVDSSPAAGARFAWAGLAGVAG